MVRIPRTKKIRIDLRKFFKKEAKKNIIGTPTTAYATYKSLINKKRGVKFDSAPNNKPNVAKLKGKNHWMVNTGETMNKGFMFTAKKTSLLVYANPKKHSGRYNRMTKRGMKQYKAKNPPTYKQIFEWNNKKGYSGVFGQLPVGSQFPKRLVKEIGNQMFPQITKGIKKKYNVKW